MDFLFVGVCVSGVSSVGVSEVSECRSSVGVVSEISVGVSDRGSTHSNVIVKMVKIVKTDAQCVTRRGRWIGHYLPLIRSSTSGKVRALGCTV